MIGRLLGALIGAEVERKRRQSGLKGAVVGAVAAGMIRRLGPVGLAIGGIYALKQYRDRRRAETPPGR